MFSSNIPLTSVVAMTNFRLYSKETLKNTSLRPVEKGASLVEYALMLALISIVSIASVRLVGASVSKSLNCAAQGIQSNDCLPPAGSCLFLCVSG